MTPDMPPVTARDARAFIRWFLAVAAGPYALLFLAALWLNLEPLQGDLTRVGGYAENDFGWRRPMRIPTEPFRAIVPEGTYARPYDVVVLGDSFSNGPGLVYWQSYFRHLTGLSVVSYDVWRPGAIDRLLASQAFRQSPPRLVVVESVERELANRFAQAPGPVAPGPEPVVAPWRVRPLPMATRVADRLEGLPWIAINLGVTQHHLLKTMERSVLGIEATDTARFRLGNARLFSNRRADQLLVFKGDLEKAAWTAAQVEAIGAGLLRIQNRVQANGRTAFALMIAPDKLTIYAPYVADPALSRLSPLSSVQGTPGLHAVPLDQALAQAVRRGEQDVYLPNNSHWGARGYELAARELCAHLRARGVLRASERR